MSPRAWAFVWLVLSLGFGLAILALLGFSPSESELQTFGVLLLSATLAQLFRVEAPNHQLYYATYVFLFAALLLLSPFLFIAVIVISHAVQWAKERAVGSEQLRNWYLQPFNMAVEIIAGLAAYAILALDPSARAFRSLESAAVVLTAACVYVLFNHMMIGAVLVLARGIPLRQSGILEYENLITDLVLLLLGAVVAALWTFNVLFIPLALTPLVLIYRALQVPQLKREAQIDAKTGLASPRHFQALFEAEFNRANRFGHALAFIMADLDLLRNINNTYGHLAGDEVLAQVGKLIREGIREYDIAGRFGGEEFSIVLPETARADAERLAERMRASVERFEFKISTSAAPIHVTMSFGVAVHPYDAPTPTELIHLADIAVYQAKLHGRNLIVCAEDVPRSIKLQNKFVEDRLPVPPGERRSVASMSPPSAAPPTALEPTEPVASPAGRERKLGGRLFWSYFALVIVAALLVTVFGVWLGRQLDWVAVGLFALCVLLTEVFGIDMYGDNSISVSVLILFAAGLLTGIPGVAIVSAVIALVHQVRIRPAFFKTPFNWAVHVLSGLVPALLGEFARDMMMLSNLPFIVAASASGAAALYLVESGLFAGAIGLSRGVGVLHTWRSQFAWLWAHYVTLCLLGLFLALAYWSFGPLGLLMFAVPAAMLRYAQKQYVDRTRASVVELERMNQELGHANEEITAASMAIHELNDELFIMLGKTMDARDPFVSGHAEQVAKYAVAIGKALDLPAPRLENLRQAALLHDIGKIAIAEQVLNKAGKLTEREYEYVKTHALLGSNLLESSKGLRHLAPFIRHHHEAWDGGGYPDGLAGEQIPIEARILAVCDAVEAMASDRPYHKALTLSEIMDEVQRCAGRQFDSAVVGALLKVLQGDGRELVANSAREVAEKHGDRPTNPVALAWGPYDRRPTSLPPS